MKMLIFGGGSDMANPIMEWWPESKRCLVDVRDERSVELAVASIDFDVMVNLAGVSRVQPVRGSVGEAWREEIETNLIGSYHIARAVTTFRPHAIMIFIASVAGLYGKPEHSGYSASKAGVISLVQSLGMEGYKAFAISPGRVHTKMREHDYPGEDVRTRLEVHQIAYVISGICTELYEPGDNIIIRKIGHDTQPIRVDRGEPFREWLKVTPIHSAP